MTIENNKRLFLACVGLTASGSEGYDHADGEIAELVEKLRAAGFADDTKTWFGRARTGQVAVNPYWPRGSCLAAACFFMDSAFAFDSAAFFAFLESAGVPPDPVGPENFREWISGAPVSLRLLDAHPAVPALWEEYRRIVNRRAPRWRAAMEKAVSAAQGFFGGEAPEMVFSPNLFTPYSADFVRLENRIVTIASAPDPETMLHETMHTAVARHRGEITAFTKKHGLAAFANRENMMELGYMADDTPASAAHVVEECFVRAFSVVLSGGSDERLQSHARYGCDSVPFIAARIRETSPTYQNLGNFIENVLDEMKKTNG